MKHHGYLRLETERVKIRMLRPSNLVSDVMKMLKPLFVFKIKNLIIFLFIKKIVDEKKNTLLFKCTKK